MEHCPMAHKEYGDYLQSNHWKSFRLKAIKHHGKKCMLCGIEEVPFFHVHHLTYKNIGHEKLTDVVVLCESCHSEVHKTGFVVKPNINKSAKQKFLTTKKWSDGPTKSSKRKYSKATHIQPKKYSKEQEEELLAWFKKSTSEAKSEKPKTRHKKCKKRYKPSDDTGPPVKRIGVIHNF
jgi:hypothetical protein